MTYHQPDRPWQESRTLSCSEILRLRNNFRANKIFGGEAECHDRGRRRAEAETICDDALESCAFLRELRSRQRQSARGSRRALPHWRPIFAFICHRGYSVSDAQDLTQDFFVMLLKGNLIQNADPNRGRFRSLLLKSLQHFLIDASEKRHARKRGGDVQFVSWDDWMAEAPSRLSISEQTLKRWPAEKIFDVRWAATVVEQALHRLAEECEGRGRRRVFDALSVSLTAEREDVSYANLSTTLGVPETSVKRLLHQLRQRYRSLLRDEVAQTVEKSAEVDEEIRYLCAALAAGQEQDEL
jgi:DNA-directed RNA polymerase specialized sigma24 family protein